MCPIIPHNTSHSTPYFSHLTLFQASPILCLTTFSTTRYHSESRKKSHKHHCILSQRRQATPHNLTPYSSYLHLPQTTPRPLFPRLATVASPKKSQKHHCSFFPITPNNTSHTTPYFSHQTLFQASPILSLTTFSTTRYRSES